MQADYKRGECLAIALFLFSMSYLLVEVFVKVSIQSVLVINLEEHERFIFHLALFADSRINGGAKISIKSSVIHGDSFFSVHSEEVMCQANIILFGLNC